jgi:prepilin-type processing-associated H-X9-DG protein
MVGDTGTDTATGPFDRIRPNATWMPSAIAPHADAYNLGFADGHVERIVGDELISDDEDIEKLWTRGNTPRP